MRNNYKSKITKLLVLTILSSTFCIIYNSSALSYESNIGVGFTFNPTLSISLSSSDLVISNLTPGTTEDSDSINISVSTNAAYGYILSTSVGGIAHNNANLVHSNNTDTFSSISPSASLVDFNDADSSTWGYSYKLANENAWSNYSGLPLYTSPYKVLLNTDDNQSTNNSLDFKITAKSSPAQPSGIYSNIINFYAVTKPTPTTLAEAYANYYQATNRTMHNGYYIMQDMADSHICENTEVVNSELQVIDIRDDKVYWIAKLADGKCWMTQNLDLDIDGGRTYTHYDTDLGWGISNTDESWSPGENYSTTKIVEVEVNNWQSSSTYPWSGDPGNTYYYTSNSSNTDIIYSSLRTCTSANHNDCSHYHAGNYYNWPAASAGITSISQSTQESINSICPAGWRLPKTQNDELKQLLFLYGIINNNGAYTLTGFAQIRNKPLYFTRAGRIYSSSVDNRGKTGYYYYASYQEDATSNFYLFFSAGELGTSTGNGRFARSIRCLAR